MHDVAHVVPAAPRSDRTPAAVVGMLLAFLLLTLAAGAARAERAHVHGEYTVHYNAVPTTVLSPDVTRHYGITRSGGRGLINIAVLRDASGAGDSTATDAQPQAVRARVVAHVRALTGQRNPVELREIVEQDAIYYIGDFRVRGEELLRFELEVTPEGARRPIPVRFEQAFVGD
jgi:hypothetical protein